VITVSLLLVAVLVAYVAESVGNLDAALATPKWK
jgi:hypothetical protein